MLADMSLSLRPKIRLPNSILKLKKTWQDSSREALMFPFFLKYLVYRLGVLILRNFFSSVYPYIIIWETFVTYFLVDSLKIMKLHLLAQTPLRTLHFYYSLTRNNLVQKQILEKLYIERVIKCTKKSTLKETLCTKKSQMRHWQTLS